MKKELEQGMCARKCHQLGSNCSGHITKGKLQTRRWKRATGLRNILESGNYQTWARPGIRGYCIVKK